MTGERTNKEGTPRALSAPTATAGTTVIELHIDIEGEDCWIQVAPEATVEEIRESFAAAEAQGLEPIPEEEEPIEYNEKGWRQWFKFDKGLMLQLGMVS